LVGARVPGTVGSPSRDHHGEGAAHQRRWIEAEGSGRCGGGKQVFAPPTTDGIRPLSRTKIAEIATRLEPWFAPADSTVRVLAHGSAGMVRTLQIGPDVTDPPTLGTAYRQGINQTRSPRLGVDLSE